MLFWSSELDSNVQPTNFKFVCSAFGIPEVLFGRSERIRTFNTHSLNVSPLSIVIRFYHLSLTQSRFQNLVLQLWVEHKSLESQSSILAVVLLRGSCYNKHTNIAIYLYYAFRGSRTRTYGVSKWWQLYRLLSSLLDVIPRSLRDYLVIKEDALAVDCSALMWLCSSVPQCPVVRPSLLYLHHTNSH